MGGSSWSSSVYDDRVDMRKKTGTTAFTYTADVHAGRAARAVHVDLKPTVTAGARSTLAGQKVREARDSDVHPNSLPIGVFFDVTGSMGEVPVHLEAKLAGLMQLLIGKGYVADPAILFGAIGDAFSDDAPLQVGQFESGIEMDDVLEKIFLEGGGGGGTDRGLPRESYQLALYYFARHTASDAWDKRQKKGYLFTMGDEASYPEVRRAHVKELIGDDLQADLTIQDVIGEVKERYQYFHIIVQEGAYRDHPGIKQFWRDLLGENVLILEHKENVAELIALTVALNEGTLDLASAADALKDAGLNVSAATSITNALVPFASSTAVGPVSSTSGQLPAVGSGSQVDRL